MTLKKNSLIILTPFLKNKNKWKLLALYGLWFGQWSNFLLIILFYINHRVFLSTRKNLKRKSKILIKHYYRSSSNNLFGKGQKSSTIKFYCQIVLGVVDTCIISYRCKLCFKILLKNRTRCDLVHLFVTAI